MSSTTIRSPFRAVRQEESEPAVSTIAAGPETLPCCVAVVGCDGSGKTRLVHDLVAELRKNRIVERRYMGLVSGETGDRIKAVPLIGVLLERYLAAKVRRAQDMKRRLPGTLSAVVMYGFSLWRSQRLAKVRRRSERGVLVIADRYPQSEVPGFHYDGPGLAVGRSVNRLVRRIARREQTLYETMALLRPALILRLLVDAETAHARKPDHPMAELQEKSAIMSRLTFNGADILEIDARLPYEEVLATALAAVEKIVAPFVL